MIPTQTPVIPKLLPAVNLNMQEMTDKYKKLAQIIQKDWKILDVGGGDQTLKLATHVIDIQPFTTTPRFGFVGFNKDEIKIKEPNWIVHDICNYPWPFPDKYFDFVWCSQVLEDIRDPIGVCKEMSRIAKAGYVNCPHKMTELISPINMMFHSEKYNGFWHHRWLVTLKNNQLVFEQKTAFATVENWTSDELVEIINTHSELSFVSLFWIHAIHASEKIYVTDGEAYESISKYIEEIMNTYGKK